MSSKTEIIIDGKNKGAIVSINGVKSELKGLADYVGGPFGASISALQKYLGLAAVGGAIGGLAALTKQAINTAAELDNMSQRTGVSVESLSTLRYAAEFGDISMEKLQTSLGRLSKNLTDISSGGAKDFALVLDKIGISTLDTTGILKPTEDVLLDLAEQFASMSDGTQKTAIALSVFGKAGMDMIPFLNLGKEGIEDLTAEAEKLGLKISAQFASDAARFNNNLTTMSYTMQGVGNSIAQELLPLLMSLSDSLKTYAVETRAASSAGAGFADVLKVVVTGLGGIYAGATIAGDALGTFYATVATFFTTGSFEQAGNVISKGFDTIEADALKFGNAFDALWKDNTSTYQNYIDSLSTKNDDIVTTSNNIKALYDAFGHPIDKDGNLTNNLKYIEALQKAQTMGGMESMMTPIPSFDISQYMTVSPDPFAGIQTDAEAFFDYYSERGALMREQTSGMFGNMGAAASMFYQSSGQKAKAWFQVQKAFNIAHAIMNTYEGATKALAQGGIFGIGMAATVIAAGLAQVAMIASQQPSASGGGGGRSAGGYSGGSSVIPNRDQGTGNYNPGQNINYNIIVQGNIVDNDRFARELVPAINRATGDGVS